MEMPLRPERGGFLRPFGCGQFIREFLLGHGPEESPRIDPADGACQTDIFYHYKRALHRAYARDAVAWEDERRIKAGKAAYTTEEFAERADWHLRRIPFKLTKARYHSFVRYFHWLKQLGWVEFTGKEEAAAIQDYYSPAPPRRFYRLSEKGIKASDREWANPQLAFNLMFHPEFDLEYFRNKRKEHLYTRKSPTKAPR